MIEWIHSLIDKLDNFTVDEEQIAESYDEFIYNYNWFVIETVFWFMLILVSLVIFLEVRERRNER